MSQATVRPVVARVVTQLDAIAQDAQLSVHDKAVAFSQIRGAAGDRARRLRRALTVRTADGQPRRS